jgi:hypothetical protein
LNNEILTEYFRRIFFESYDQNKPQANRESETM